MTDEDEARWQLESLERTRREGERLAAMYAAYDFQALRRRLLSRFGEVVGTALREAGFQGRVPHLYRPRGRWVDLLSLQVDRYGGGFMVNLARTMPGADEDPAAIRLIALEFEHRARLTLDPTGRESLWFRYDGPEGSPEAQQDAALIEVREMLDEADHWWQTGMARRHVVTS